MRIRLKIHRITSKAINGEELEIVETHFESRGGSVEGEGWSRVGRYDLRVRSDDFHLLLLLCRHLFESR